MSFKDKVEDEARSIRMSAERSNLTKDIVVPTLLFGALSPGLFLTIPPESGGLLRSGQTSPRAVLMHMGVFGGALYLYRYYMNSRRLRPRDLAHA
ncbi:hypothetical protein QOT17_004680 [Balamuthia mandrillaris]